jgi:hypothetical protein
VFKTFFGSIIRKLSADDRSIVINVNVNNLPQAPPATTTIPAAQPCAAPVKIDVFLEMRRSRAATALVELLERAPRV